jgi:hypothetical protein
MRGTRFAAVRTAALLVALGLFGRPVAAAAAGSSGEKVEARRHFQLGVAAAQAGAYRDAITEFTRAYSLSPNFAVLYNVATAQAALGDAAAALATFARYLADGGDAIAPARRAKVADEMRRLSARTGFIVARGSPDGARLTLDGGALAPASPGEDTRVRVNAGVHKVAATRDGYAAAEETITVASGGVVTVVLALSPLPAAPETPPPVAPPMPPPLTRASPLLAPALAAAPVAATPAPAVERAADLAPPAAPRERPASSTARTIGYVVAGAGLATLVAGGLLYARAWSQAESAIGHGCTQDIDNSCDATGRNEWLRAQDDAKLSRVVAGVGGAVFVVGAGIVFLSPSATARPPGLAFVGRW